jgi:Zn-dependent protease
MSPQVLIIISQIVVLLFAISLHEAAHAWTAWKLGDPTAMMLGRVTLNPLKHIDPIGTVLFPLLLAITHLPVFGWAKPTPVTTRNFKNVRRDDTLTTIAGPVSNLLAAVVCLGILLVLKFAAPAGFAQVAYGISSQTFSTPDGGPLSILFPIVMLLLLSIEINLALAVFNMLPVPPLDGGHIVRNFLPYRAAVVFDRVGMISLFLIFFFGGRIISGLTGPMVNAFLRVVGL